MRFLWHTLIYQLFKTGETSEVTYDIEFHQKNMENLSEIASTLTGHRWEKTRMLLSLTARVGFFLGTDTGLARAVREIKLESVEDKKNTGNNQTK